LLHRASTLLPQKTWTLFQQIPNPSSTPRWRFLF
jgi:hypothetical protein